MKKLLLPIRALVLSSGCLLFASISLVASELKTGDDFTLPYYDTPEFTPKWLKSDDPLLEDFHAIANFSFTNQLGEKVTNKLVNDKVYVANFFFSTCPGICPKIRSNLVKVQETYADNEQVMIISHSIQPEHDSVQVLQQYAQENNVNANKWHLLTGNREEIYKLAREDYFANEDLGEYMANEDFLHTENLVLIDKKGHIRGIYNGLKKASVRNLLDDIRLLL